MIEDLKADSARWEQERRAAARPGGGGSGGTQHSSQASGLFVRSSSNSPVGSRDHRGQDYNSWKNSQPEHQYNSQYGGSSMDVDYNPPHPTASAAPPPPNYPAPQYSGHAPGNYPPTTYAPPAHTAPHPASYAQPQSSYPYQPSHPQPQYTPPPVAQTPAGIHPPPPVTPGAYKPEFVQGASYQAVGGYPAPGPNRMPPPVPYGSAPPPRAYNAPPPAGTPGYGPEPDYAYPPPVGAPANQSYPIDPAYGRGAYTTATTKSPEASSDVLGSPTGPAQRPAYAAPPDPPYEAHQNPPLQPSTTPTTAAPAPLPTGSAAPPPRRDPLRDSEPRDTRAPGDSRGGRRLEPERERDMREDWDRNRPRH